MLETIKDLRIICEACGIYFDTYSPGDGITRYRFFTEPADYFGGSESIKLYTALGIKEAITYARGYQHATMNRGRRPHDP